MNFKDSYFGIWQQAWTFHKKYAGVKGDDEWQCAVDESNQLCESYRGQHGYEFMRNLLSAVISEMERSSKNEQM